MENDRRARPDEGDPVTNERRRPDPSIAALVQRFDDLDNTLAEIKTTQAKQADFIAKVDPVFSMGIWAVGVLFVGMTGAAFLVVRGMDQGTPPMGKLNTWWSPVFCPKCGSNMSCKRVNKTHIKILCLDHWKHNFVVDESDVEMRKFWNHR